MYEYIFIHKKNQFIFNKMNIQLIIETLKHASFIAIFVFSMMIFVDYLNVMSKGKMNKMLKANRFRQYFITSSLGSTPGCLGAFTNVSFYTHGLISFGAVTGGMIATSGDEAFVMLAMFPKTALLLFLLLFVLGIVLAWVTDKLILLLKIKVSNNCEVPSFDKGNKECKCFDSNVIKNITLIRLVVLILIFVFIVLVAIGMIGPSVWNWIRITLLILLSLTLFILATVPEHYIKDHIWGHIAKKHLLKIFLWSFFAILLVHLGLDSWDLESYVQSHMFWVFIIASMMAIIPESGPHLIFVMMFAKGIIPFSVLLTSSIIQDGHGMLPMFSYSVKDSLLMKLFNLIFGLAIGGSLYLMGF